MVELSDLESKVVSAYVAAGFDIKAMGKGLSLAPSRIKSILSRDRVKLAIDGEKRVVMERSRISLEGLNKMALEVKDRAADAGVYFGAELRALELLGKWNGLDKGVNVNLGVSFNHYARMLNEPDGK